MNSIARVLDRDSPGVSQVEIAPQRAVAKPTLPAGTRIYAIGDIHGRFDLLQMLCERIAVDLNQRPVLHTEFVFLGDYIDRGADSNLVIEYLSCLADEDNTIFLRGNHEQVLLDFLDDAQVLGNWRQFGGLETLNSYNVPVHKVEQGFGLNEAQALLKRRLPPSHLAFLENTCFSYQCGDYYFCHAGVNPALRLTQQKSKDLLWIRDEFLNCERPFEKVIVHGHTQVQEPEVTGTRINIDTGAYLTNNLSCVVLEGTSVHTLSTLAPGYKI